MKKITLSQAKEIVRQIDPKAKFVFDAPSHKLEIISDERIRKVFRKFISPRIDNIVSFDESKGVCTITAFADEKAVEEYKAPPFRDWNWERNNQQPPSSQEILDYVGRND